MNGEQVKTWGVLASPLLAIAGLAWAVSSWRGAGARLRIHALLYREVLVLWVFNAGRTTDQVERIVLGGRRGGIGGLELTKDLGAPIKLAPGESWRREFRWKSIVPEDRQRILSGGWESVWLLLGSMQQRRVEVTAVGEDYPPRVGWRLAPRGAPRQEPYGALAWLALVVLVVTRAFMVSGYEPARRRVERWVVAAVATMATTIWLTKAGAANSHWAPWTNYVVIGVGAALAWPGGIATVYREVRRRVKTRQRRRAFRSS
jgi:hypothetical protein